MAYDPARNEKLNGVTVDERRVSWAQAFPRNYAEQFRGIEPATVPAYRPDE